MSKLKIGTGKNVLVSAKERIAYAFDNFEKVYVSFSGGKDSSVMFHLAAEEARKRNRTLGVLFIDLEAQYDLTIRHVEEMVEEYKDCTELFWVCLPMLLRNAVSQFQPRWCCWEEGVEWVREKPKKAVPADLFPFFVPQMEFEEFMVLFGVWYGQDKETAALVGIRCDESLNRFRTIASKSKEMHNGKRFTTKVEEGLYNVYPLYDWKTSDLWTYHAKFPEKKHNQVYDRMQLAGVPLSKMRLCQPYGDDQRRGLWLFHLLEPHTWFKLVARVNGANSGALYVEETGNITGYNKISLPPGHTWKSFCNLLLRSLPKKTREHYLVRFKSFITGWKGRGYTTIPDEAPRVLETKHWAPSWRRLCKVILRNDHWCKGLGLTQPKSAAYERFMDIKRTRKATSEIPTPQTRTDMKLTIPRDVLLNAVSIANRGVTGRSTMPALSCVRMEVKEGQITVQGTDLDITITATTPVADMEAGGAAIFSGKRLEALLKTSAEDAVAIQKESDDLKVKLGKSVATIKGLPLSEWPELETPAGTNTITLPQRVLKVLINRVACNASTDPGRANLNGVLVEGSGTLAMVATDGRRLTTEATEFKMADGSFVVPNAGVSAIRGVLGDSGDATLTFSENAVLFSAPGVAVSSKLIEGNFPNWRQVLPSRDEFFPVARKPLVSALSRVTIFTDEKSPLVKLAFGDGSVAVSARSEFSGALTEELDIARKGKDVTIGVNGSFLLGALKAVDVESVEFSVVSDADAIVMRSGAWTHVLMPLRVA